MHEVTRYHDFSAGHRVVGHENKCRHLHGHNYRVHFTCIAPRGLDRVGRVVDFGVIKDKLCRWLEEHWDHKMLIWTNDDMMCSLDTCGYGDSLRESIVWVPFNPTAENMAEALVEAVAPVVLEGTGVELIRVRIEETRKCSATYTKR